MSLFNAALIVSFYAKYRNFYVLQTRGRIHTYSHLFVHVNACMSLTLPAELKELNARIQFHLLAYDLYKCYSAL